jgi:hypothetical protein
MVCALAESIREIDPIRGGTMATAMLWRTHAYGDFRVTVVKLSANGMASLIKFTRGERYRPAEAGKDGTMWVMSSQLHKVTPRPKAQKAPETISDPVPVAKQRARASARKRVTAGAPIEF